MSPSYASKAVSICGDFACLHPCPRGPAMLGLVRAALLFLCAVVAGCGDDRQCTFDVDCPIGDRCVATRCVPVQLAPLRDAAVVADGSTDAEPPDSGGPRDAGVDAQVDPDCTLTLEPADGISVSTAEGSDEAPLLARAGVGLFGLVVRQAAGLMGEYFDEMGSVVLAPPDAIDADAAVGDFAMTTALDGSLVVVWHEVDDRLHGGLVTDLGIAALRDLTAPTTGIGTPAIARTSTGYLLAWTDRADGAELIGTRPLGDPPAPIADAVRVHTPGPARLPALADVDAEDVPFAWNDWRSGAAQPYAATSLPDGSVQGEIEVSSDALAGRVATVATPFGLFISWVEPGVPGEMGAVHVSRIEGGIGRDNVIATAFTLDDRTSIAWDGDRLFVAWHRGAIDAAEATVAAVRPDLTRVADLSLGAGTARPSVAADETLRGVAWLAPATSEVLFGVLSCGP